jgi:hypothetical protein
MAAYGYDPLTGKELWRVVERGNFSMSTRRSPATGSSTIPPVSTRRRSSRCGPTAVAT